LLHAEKDLREQADAWLTGVQNIVGALSQSFSKLMEGLQYHGKLSLRQTGKLSDYEIVIEVGFRGDGEKAELSGSRHSGGERAVSTIMYLMALQQLTSAPFRVVDEVIRTGFANS
jgi:chromosome segregation ATPase